MQAGSRPDRQSGQASKAFLRFVEENGIVLRQRAGLGPEGRLDPFAVASRLGIVIWSPDDLQQLGTDDLQRLNQLDARTWSGGGTELPDGRLLILLNPNQTPERAVVTVMEEVAHVHFGHQPTPLVSVPLGPFGRMFDASAEDEAYWTAAAALLPSSVVARAVWRGISVETIAATYGVSNELAEFRIKTLRLWQWHLERLAAA